MSNRLRWGIQVWLLLLTIVTMVPTTLFSVFTVYRLGNQQRMALTSDLSHRADATAAAVAQRLDVMATALLTLANSDAALNQDLRTLYLHAQRVMALNHDAAAVALIGPGGEQIFNTLMPFGAPLPAVGGASAVKTVFAENRPALSEMFMGVVNRRNVAAVNVPVTINGKIAYCLRMAILPAALSRVLEQQAMPPDWTVAVVDQTGTIVARNRMADRFIGTRTNAAVLAAIRDGRQGVFQTVTLEGTEVAAVTAPIAAWQWSIVLGLPTDVVNQSLYRSLAEIAIGGAILLAIGLLAAFWVAQHLGDQVAIASAVGRGAAPVLDESIAREREFHATAESPDRMASDHRLAEAHAELARSNADLEQFAYVASHDLREPLRMISTYLSLVERRYGHLFEDSGKEFIAFARDGALKMDRLVLGLLEFSRIDRRGAPMEPMKVADALETALTNLTLAIDENDALIRVDWTALPTVEGDPIQVAMLFQNLVGNAIKYRSKARRLEIQVDSRRIGGEWEFSVRDNGIGIEPQYFERIFAIFQRLHTQAQYDGTGLGLAVAKKIVERHGGRLAVESTPGTGSTFRFTLKAPPPGT